MHKFTMSAFARYPDGSTDDAFAQVSGKTAAFCFEAMATEVARWLPTAITPEDGEVPDAIELTLEWKGEEASAKALTHPSGPRDEGAADVRSSPADVRPLRRRGPSCCPRRALVTLPRPRSLSRVAADAA